MIPAVLLRARLALPGSQSLGSDEPAGPVGFAEPESSLGSDEPAGPAGYAEPESSLGSDEPAGPAGFAGFAVSLGFAGLELPLSFFR